MSAGTLNGASLALRSLTVGGQPVTGGQGGTTTLEGPGGSAVSGAIVFAGDGVTQNGQTFTISGGGGGGGVSSVTGKANECVVTPTTGACIVGLAPPIPAPTAGSYTNANITVDALGRVTAAADGTGGSGGNMNCQNLSATVAISALWSGTATYAPGDIVRYKGATGDEGADCLYICSVGITGGTGPLGDPTHWTPLAGQLTVVGADTFSGPLTVVGAGGITPTIGKTGGGGATLTLTGGVSAGVASLTAAGVTAPATGAVTLVAGTGIAITGAGGAAGSLTIASTAAGGTTTPVAWGTLTVPASPGSVINIYVGSTAPGPPAVQLVARGGTLPSTFATTNMMICQGVVSTGGGVAPPNAAFWAPSFTASTTATLGCGATMTAGQLINWVLYDSA